MNRPAELGRSSRAGPVRGVWSCACPLDAVTGHRDGLGQAGCEPAVTSWTTAVLGSGLVTQAPRRPAPRPRRSRHRPSGPAGPGARPDSGDLSASSNGQAGREPAAKHVPVDPRGCAGCARSPPITPAPTSRGAVGLLGVVHLDQRGSCPTTRPGPTARPTCSARAPPRSAGPGSAPCSRASCTW